MSILVILFFEFFKIALLTIGGGLAMIPAIEDVFVNKRKLLKNSDILDMVALTQSVPGLIAINSAVFVGHKLAGWKGSLSAMLGVIFPSIVIIILIAMFFPLLHLEDKHLLKAFNCIRACVTGIFVVLMVKIGKAVLKSKSETIIVILLTLCLLTDISKVWIILAACLLGYAVLFLSEKTVVKK